MQETPTKEQIEEWKKLNWSKMGGRYRGSKLFYKALEALIKR